VLDIGWVEVEPLAVKAIGKRFCPVGRLWLETSFEGEGDLLLLTGYPCEKIAPENGLFYATPFSIATKIKKNTKWHDETFLVEYQKEGTNSQRGESCLLPNPAGLSGGGIWKFGGQQGLWDPSQAKLVGIQRSWSEGDLYARANRVMYWLEMVVEDFPQLGLYIENVLDK